MAEDRNRSRTPPCRSFIYSYHLYTVLPGKATIKRTRSVTHPYFPSLASTRSHVAERDSIPSSTLTPAIFCWRQEREKMSNRLVILPPDHFSPAVPLYDRYEHTEQCYPFGTITLSNKISQNCSPSPQLLIHQCISYNTTLQENHCGTIR